VLFVVPFSALTPFVTEAVDDSMILLHKPGNRATGVETVMKHLYLMSGLALLALTAGVASAEPMTDAQRDQCLIVGKALVIHTQDNLTYMTSDEQKGQFSEEDIQQKRDIIQHLNDDFIPRFDVGQTVDAEAVADKAANEDAPTLGDEANACITLSQQ